MGTQREFKEGDIVRVRREFIVYDLAKAIHILRAGTVMTVLGTYTPTNGLFDELKVTEPEWTMGFITDGMVVFAIVNNDYLQHWLREMLEWVV